MQISTVRRGGLAALALALAAVPAALAAPGGGAAGSAMPIQFAAWNPCTGEFVDISGTIHTVVGDGGLRIHQNFSEVTGVGESSGTAYSITGTSHLRSTADTTLMTVHQNVVSRGADPNQATGLVLEMTLGPDGQVTTVQGSFDECRG